jgi:hypothetical protein
MKQIFDRNSSINVRRNKAFRGLCSFIPVGHPAALIENSGLSYLNLSLKNCYLGGHPDN